MKKLFPLLLVLPAAAIAQQQVKPPVANYWMNVETAAGMSMPGMGAMGGFMGGMMGGQGASGRKLQLMLGSQRPSADGPRADHYIPSGMSMGPSLPLVTPQRVPVERGEPTERGLPQGMEQPRGRMLIYWGCGETARAGQPVIIDFASGGGAAGLTSRRVSMPTPPSPGRARTYGDWPNQQDSKAVPNSASLIGDHQIKGNYSPDIQFPLGDGHDFMDRVELSTAPRGAGAVNVTWNAVGTATGYFATVFGSDGGNDFVMWTSSEGCR